MIKKRKDLANKESINVMHRFRQSGTSLNKLMSLKIARTMSLVMAQSKLMTFRKSLKS